MRTHRDIIEGAGGPSAIAKATGAEPGTAKQWKRLDSIPAAYWAAIDASGIATLRELAEAAANRRGGPITATQDAAA